MTGVQTCALPIFEELTPEQRGRLIAEMEERMREAARKFEFEKAAQLRDKVKALRERGVAGVAAG